MTARVRIPPKCEARPSDLFAKCTRRSRSGLSIECRLGLWSVSMGNPTEANRSAVESAARHYWFQYYQDGEYAALLANAAYQPPKGEALRLAVDAGSVASP